jgi:hypothetical protein
VTFSISRRECLGAIAGSAALSVVPAKLTAAAGSTDFYVVTSDSAASQEFLSALTNKPQLSHVPFSLDTYPAFSAFIDDVADCVLVGLADEASSVIIESKLNDRGRSLARVQYVDSKTANSRRIRQAALDTLQTALSSGRGAPAPVDGQAGASALAAFYAWI